MASPIGKLTAVLGIDAREFTTGVEGAKKSLGGFGVSSDTIFKGIGLAAAGGFALATKGAAEAETAQGKFMAATGATREEAKKFVSGMDSLAGSAGTVGMKFEDLAALGTMVEQQFGTTGQKTIDLTENIAEFSKVTGQDATQAAGDLEDTLSSYGLSADDARGFMDQLVASNQKFGTEAGPAALDALRNMSPALQTMGGDLTDGVGFLNLFETAGLDAGAAATGLNKAVKELKPGQTLDDLIAQIGGIEDPTLRAQKAIELFGTKAGTKLAAAIKPGMTSLDDFKVSAEDAAGTTGKAADDMLTFGDRIKGFAEKALAGAREVGQDFGPAITGLASLGSLAAPFAKGIAGMLGTVAKDIGLLGAAAAVGEAEGEAQAVGATGGKSLQSWLAKYTGMTTSKVAAAKIAGEAEGFAEGSSAAESAGAAFASKVPAFLTPVLAAAGLAGGAVLGGGVALAGSQAITDAAKGDNSPIGMAFHPWSVLATKAGTDAGTAAATSTVGTYADQVRESLSTFGPHIDPYFAAAGTDAGDAAGKAGAFAFADSLFWPEAGKKAAKATSGAFAVSPEWVATSRNAAQKITDAFNQEVLSQRGEAQDVWTAFADMMKHPLDTAAEIAELKGDLTSKKMLKGLASNDPQVRTWAENTRDTIEGRIDDLQKLLSGDAVAASNAFNNNLDFGDGVSEAKRTAQAINDWLNSIKTHIKVNIDINDPTGQGPTAHGHHAMGGWARAGETSWVGELGPELITFPADAYVTPNSDIQPIGPAENFGKGTEIHYHVNVGGLVEAKSPADIGRVLRRIGSLGLHTQPVMTT